MKKRSEMKKFKWNRKKRRTRSQTSGNFWNLSFPIWNQIHKYQSQFTQQPWELSICYVKVGQKWSHCLDKWTQVIRFLKSNHHIWLRKFQKTFKMSTYYRNHQLIRKNICGLFWDHLNFKLIIRFEAAHRTRFSTNTRIRERFSKYQILGFCQTTNYFLKKIITGQNLKLQCGGRKHKIVFSSDVFLFQINSLFNSLLSYELIWDECTKIHIFAIVFLTISTINLDQLQISTWI